LNTAADIGAIYDRMVEDKELIKSYRSSVKTFLKEKFDTFKGNLHSETYKAQLEALIDDYDLVRKNIQILRNDYDCDIVIVSHHGGAEGSAATRVTRNDEWFGGGPRGNVYEFSHLCVDAGADLVFGHGPHVVRAMELYKGKLIAYSLGNFCTPYKMNIKGRCGYAPILRVRMTSEGEFLGGDIVAARQTTRTGPKLDPQKLVVKEIQNLSLLDFPESDLLISDEGELSVKR
jgi:hypothetical protein